MFPQHFANLHGGLGMPLVRQVKALKSVMSGVWMDGKGNKMTSARFLGGKKFQVDTFVDVSSSRVEIERNVLPIMFKYTPVWSNLVDILQPTVVSTSCHKMNSTVSSTWVVSDQGVIFFATSCG